jgi:predicted site-specific integrase-resolvase
MQEINVAGTQVANIWVSGPELCRRLGVSRSTVARWRHRGLPHVGHDRLRRYHLSTVLKWISENA